MPLLVSMLVFLFILSAFFAAAETGLMAANPYRLKHLAKTSLAARTAENLLKYPERLLSVILIGNNFANISISVILTFLATQYFDGAEDLFFTIFVTLISIIVAEVPPKTLAAIFPERVSLISAIPITIILYLFFPLIWATYGLSNMILKLFGVSMSQKSGGALSKEELKTAVFEAGKKLPRKHRAMMLSIIDLEQIAIDEIMVPKNDIVGINIEEDWEDIIHQLESCQHTVLPIYKNELNHTLGLVHIKDIMNLMASNKFDKSSFKEAIDDAYFVPEGTSLAMQLINFQKSKRRQALVVNEYGDVIGLVALEDILEEIVGEYTTDLISTRKDIMPQKDGSILVDGSINVRFLNRTMGWELPTTGGKTLSGLIIDLLEFIPDSNICLMVGKYPTEVMQTQHNRIKTVRIFPELINKLEN
jgi:Mg2+/Co2+ transporter CorB